MVDPDTVMNTDPPMTVFGWEVQKITNIQTEYLHVRAKIDMNNVLSFLLMTSWSGGVKLERAKGILSLIHISEPTRRS